MMTYLRTHAITIWLSVGLLAGLALALLGLLPGTDATAQLPQATAARVAGIHISRTDLARAVGAVSADRRTPPNKEQRGEILERLINEALLIEHGLDQDLVRQSPQLRDQVVDTVLSSLRGEADAVSFTPAQVELFYQEHAALFQGPDLLQVAVIRTQDLTQAQDALTALQAGEDGVQVAQRFNAHPPVVPAAPLPLQKLRDYLGPTLTQRAAELAVGESAAPIAHQGGYVVLKLLARKATQPPPLAQVEETVLFEMRRRAAEDLLQQRLAALRQRYAVRVADDLR